MDLKKTGMFLKELRKEKHLTQEQLSEIFSVTNRCISRWENGVNMPDFDLVIDIANYFDISIEEFLDILLHILAAFSPLSFFHSWQFPV